MRTAWNKGSLMITPQQVEWLKENFANEENFIIADTLGISETTMHRYARLFGLKKSKAYMRRCQKEATDAAHYFNRISGRNKALAERMRNGGMSPKFLACRITKENSLWVRCPEKMQASRKKHGQTLHQVWEEEKRRVKAGLPQKTRLKVAEGKDRVFNRLKAVRKYYLKSRGYRIDGLTAWWNENTLRAPQLEKKDTIFKYRMELQ